MLLQCFVVAQSIKQHRYRLNDWFIHLGLGRFISEVAHNAVFFPITKSCRLRSI